MARTFMGAFNAEVTSLPWTTPTPYPHVSPILLAFFSGGALEVAFDDMSFFLLKSWDVEDRIILDCISRLFGLSLLVLGNYPPWHRPWVLMESGSSHKFSGPTHLNRYSIVCLRFYFLFYEFPFFFTPFPFLILSSFHFRPLFYNRKEIWWSW